MKKFLIPVMAFILGINCIYAAQAKEEKIAALANMQDIEGKIQVQKESKDNSELKNSFIKQRDKELLKIDEDIKAKKDEMAAIRNDKSLTDTEKGVKLKNKQIELDRLNNRKVTAYKLYNARINSMK